MFGEYKRKNTVNHMFYLLMIRALTFKENYGYRIKVAGDEERYVAAIDGNVRSILAKDAPTIPNAQIVVQLLHTGSNMYKFKFCDRFLTAKPDDSGVVAIYSQETGLDVFDIQVEGTAFKFFNAKKNLCLAQTSSYDSALRGYSLNVSPCQDNIPNKFVLLEVGPIYYYCPELAAAFCGVPSPVKPIHENIRYSHHGFLDNDVSLGHKNSSSWSFEGEYNTHGAEFSGDFDGFSGSAFGASVGYDRANAHGHPVDPRNPYHNLRRGHRYG